MVKPLLSTIKVCFLAAVLFLPFVAGCGGSGGGIEPKAGTAGPEPQRARAGVQGGAEGGGGQQKLGN